MNIESRKLTREMLPDSTMSVGAQILLTSGYLVVCMDYVPTSRDEFCNMKLGALLEEPFVPGQALKVTGSAMMVYAASKDEILTRLKSDPFAREGVWDVDNVKIFPFFRPNRNPV